ncbi:hypothetical protein [Aerococcus sp. UMB7834]|uniref:hypothetical protein n=1 Tax=Aerococcus sp. UMB7834 TaxID=3046342 RepID=UPI0025504BA5|nr:hypothetical protein [Aerococcus sp. UMB7834]MDK6805278.1 hypothetical protein [Aerococcus sp. UMB7834]
MKQTSPKRASIFLTSLSCFFTILLLYQLNLQLYQAQVENVITMEGALKAESLALLALALENETRAEQREQSQSASKSLEEELSKEKELSQNLKKLEKNQKEKEAKFKNSKREKEATIDDLLEELHELEMKFANFDLIAYDRDIVDEEDSSSPLAHAEASDWLANYEDLIQQIEHEQMEVQALKEQWDQERLVGHKEADQLKKELKETQSAKADKRQELNHLNEQSKASKYYRFNLGEVKLKLEEDIWYCQVILDNNGESYQFTY